MTIRAALVAPLAIVISSATAFASGNPANDQFLKLSAAKKTELLGQLVGDGCKPIRSFYNGIGTRGISKDRAFWSVACADGRRFMVTIEPDAGGSTRILDCAVMKALNTDNCFKKFDP